MNDDPRILLELEATTLRHQDASPEVAAALAADPALDQAWQQSRQVDQALAAAYLAAPLPLDLEADLMRRLDASRLRETRTRWRHSTWLAVAACLCLLGLVAAALRRAPLQPWQQETLAVFDELEHMRRPLGHTSRQVTELLAYLRKNGAPEPRMPPDRLRGLTAFGCTPVIIAGRRASILCFALPSGQEAHLAVIEGDLKPAAHSGNVPALGKNGPWHHATWREGGQTLVLGTCAGAEELRKLLGLC